MFGRNARDLVCCGTHVRHRNVLKIVLYEVQERRDPCFDQLNGARKNCVQPLSRLHSSKATKNSNGKMFKERIVICRMSEESARAKSYPIYEEEGDHDFHYFAHYHRC